MIKTKMSLYLLSVSLFLVGFLSSCVSTNLAYMKNQNMNKLSLGMNIEQVSDLLGKNYVISKKEIVNQDTLEIISYRGFPNDDEVYLFTFKNNKLEKWEREFIPKYRVIEQK